MGNESVIAIVAVGTYVVGIVVVLVVAYFIIRNAVAAGILKADRKRAELASQSAWTPEPPRRGDLGQPDPGQSAGRGED